MLLMGQIRRERSARRGRRQTVLYLLLFRSCFFYWIPRRLLLHFGIVFRESDCMLHCIYQRSKKLHEKFLSSAVEHQISRRSMQHTA